jgi:hypothetical protein
MTLKKHLERNRDVLEHLETYNLDALSLCSEIDSLESEYRELQQRAKQGIPTEKISPTGGAETIIEAHPQIEIACIKDRVALVKLRNDLVRDAVKTAQLDEPADTNITLNIVPRMALPNG